MRDRGSVTAAGASVAKAAVGLTVLAVCLTPSAGLAWSPHTEVVMAREAGRYAPRDLRRQIDKHSAALREGVLVSIENPQTGRPLDEVLHEEIENAIAAIRAHEPFDKIVQRLGQVSHYIALANNPLAVESSDPNEPRYARDWPRYVESAQGRFEPAWYGEGRLVRDREDLQALLGRAFERGRSAYPLLAREYAHIGYGEGERHFDDRSTAFALSALAYSHAISDTIGVLRYIWLRAGGGDFRQGLNLTAPTGR